MKINYVFVLWTEKITFKNNYMIHKKSSFYKYFYCESVVKFYSSLIVFWVKKGKCINIESQVGNYPFRTDRLYRSP